MVAAYTPRVANEALEREKLNRGVNWDTFPYLLCHVGIEEIEGKKTMGRP